MRILITGGTGLLGKAIIEESGGKNEIAATYVGGYEMENSREVNFHKLDLLDFSGNERLVSDFKPEIVIHTASIGSPDYAEKYREKTWDVNVGGTKALLSICERLGTKFIFISSNGIYDGENAPYEEMDEARPVNYYGETKLAGENVVKESGHISAIVRPILMYGWNHEHERPNIVTIALAKLKKGEEIFAYDDVFSNALYVNSCARAILKIIEAEKYDVFNIAGAQRESIFGLLKRTAEVFGHDPALVKPVQRGFFNELVPRPTDTSYKTGKMEKVLGIKPLTLDGGLESMRRARK